jgi:hypothetical protein
MLSYVIFHFTKLQDTKHDTRPFSSAT